MATQVFHVIGGGSVHRVLIADDHELVREGLSILIVRGGFAVVADAGNGQEAVVLAAAHQPDIAVLDMSMPLMNGLDAALEIRRLSPHTKSVLLSRHDAVDYVLAAMRAGIKGYPDISGAMVEAVRTDTSPPDDGLTGRERQVLKLIAEGYSTKECATILGVSVKTADSHRTRMMRKLSIHGTAGLVRYAVRHHLADA